MPEKKQPSIAVLRALKNAPKITDNHEFVYKPISVHLTDSQLRKVKEMSMTFALSERLVPNLAVRYAIIYANKKKKPLEELRLFPKRFGKIPFVVEPTADTVMMLDENQLMDKSPKLVIFGIKLLHERFFSVLK